MAPELAIEALDTLTEPSVVLDPMCGSGTVLRHAVDRGHRAVGFDLDPLAILMSRVACRRLNSKRVLVAAADAVCKAASSRKRRVPWIDSDPETKDFVEYWFAPDQAKQLRKLALVLHSQNGATSNFLRLALSRTIITKSSGASLARDVSHSRPHRVADDNDYDVFAGFLAAADQLATLVDRTIDGTASIVQRDARRLPPSLAGKVDLIVTSPPYLNAIDYMRGHRLSLVWLGHDLKCLRAVRSSAVGAERMADRSTRKVKSVAPRMRGLTTRQQGMFDRYAEDMCAFALQMRHALSSEGEAVVVVGDSAIGGTYVRNSLVVERAAERAGFEVVERRSRRLPASSRYLPPPRRGGGALNKRMQKEVVLRLRPQN